MASPTKKRRLNGNGSSKPSKDDSQPAKKHFPGAALDPKTDDDVHTWQGFCEIDSDPAYFSVMLEEFGVKDIRMREVYSLDEDMLAFLPRPVHGLVFLFKYRADDATKQEASCPDHVWFANQTHDQACATVALLNIVNNIPGADLGEPLQQFKDYTADFTPALRGDAIGTFEFVKHIHNSFARKMDMLNADLSLQNRYEDRAKRSKKPAASADKGRGKKRVAEDDDGDDEESGFHFIAFVPIGNEVWKMDGLERQPVKLGFLDKDAEWLSLVVGDLGQRMEQFEEDDINFNLLACVQDPTVGLKRRLHGLCRSIDSVASDLDTVELAMNKDKEDSVHWLDSLECKDDINEVLGQVKDAAKQSVFDQKTIDELDERRQEARGDLTSLVALCQSLLQERSEILASIASEEGEAQLDRQKAAERRHDFGPLIHTWLRMLAEQDGLVQELLQKIS